MFTVPAWLTSAGAWMSPDTPSTSADRFGVFVTAAQRWATSCCEEDRAGMTGPDQPADVYAGPYRRSSAERAAGGPADAPVSEG